MLIHHQHVCRVVFPEISFLLLYLLLSQRIDLLDEIIDPLVSRLHNLLCDFSISLENSDFSAVLFSLSDGVNRSVLFCRHNTSQLSRLSLTSFLLFVKECLQCLVLAVLVYHCVFKSIVLVL